MMRCPTSSEIVNRCKRTIGTVVAVVTLFTTPAAATHDTLDCTVPADLVPLFNLLDTFTQLALLAGVTLGTLGLSIAGIMMLWPGQDMTRRGKDVAKHVIIGTIILLSAQAIVSFITSQLGTTLCA